MAIIINGVDMEDLMKQASQGQPQKEEKIEKTEKSFLGASALTLENLAGNTTVNVHDKDDITVILEGPKDALKGVNLSQQGNTVIVKGSKTGGTSGTSISMKSGRSGSFSQVITTGSVGSMVVSDGNMTVSIGGKNNNLKIIVNVPTGTAVKVSENIGQTTIGNTNGSLEVNVKSGDVVADNVKDAVLNVSGGGDITVSEVNGSLSANVAGSGDIKVNGGKVSMLMANVTGSGDIRFRGRATNASLTVVGSGDIRVSRVENKPMTNVVGSGDIDVDNWG